LSRASAVSGRSGRPCGLDDQRDELITPLPASLATEILGEPRSDL
jgi:hypothetical protein